MTGIVYVFQDHYPWDVRAEKFACAMTASGHAVTIVSRNRTGDERRSSMDGYAIRRLPKGWGGLSRTLLNFPAFFSPVWIQSIIAAVRESGAGLIIIRDLPLAPAAWLAGKLTGVPVMMDMAEDYPAMLQSAWTHDGRQPQDILVRNPKLLAMLERWIVPRLDGIAVVSPASATRVATLLGNRSVPVRVVGNTPRLELHSESEPSALADQIAGLSGLRLLYVGYVTKARGISVVIDALAEVLARGVEATLIVVGDGIGLEALRQQADAKAIADRVLLPGWLDQKFVPAVIGAADICIVPHFVDPHVETTLPNKIYDYMLQAKPVLVTHSKALRDVVENNQCGLSYHDTSATELADAILSLADPELRTELGANGRSAVREHLNWAHDARVLNEFVSELIEAP